MTLEEFKKLNAYWFSRGALRFFKSRVSAGTWTPGISGAYFVSSEQGPRGPRRYSVRWAEFASGKVYTANGFQAYASYREALAALKTFASGSVVVEIK